MANALVRYAEEGYDELKAVVEKIGGELQPVEAAVETAATQALSATAQLIERNGGQLLISEALALVDALVTGNWSSVVSTLIANAKAAGVQTVTQEEQLAGSAALQVAQVLKAQQAGA